MVKLNHPWRILLKQQISDITNFLTFNELWSYYGSLSGRIKGQ